MNPLAGGYHLFPYKREVIAGIAERHQALVGRLVPAHCTGHLGFKLLGDAYGDRYQFFGLGSTLVP